MRNHSLDFDDGRTAIHRLHDTLDRTLLLGDTDFFIRKTDRGLMCGHKGGTIVGTIVLDEGGRAMLSPAVPSELVSSDSIGPADILGWFRAAVVLV